jgi:ubiquinone/menaquinone biosynthesis C-methylase UbiE
MQNKKTPRQFYTELGYKKLAERKPSAYTKAELTYLLRLIRKDSKILDLACGYGRFAIPLAKQGYKIEGLDITPSFIKKAKEESHKNGIKIRFRVGDMGDMPYKSESFNVVICMWDAFSEILGKKDQSRAIKEIYRVLKPGGFAIIEVHNNKSSGYQKPNKIADIVANPHYKHNKKSLMDLMLKAKIIKSRTFLDNFGGRKRLFLQFWK